MEIFQRLRGGAHEQVVFFRDQHAGLRAIVAIHNTTLGPAIGGVLSRFGYGVPMFAAAALSAPAGAAPPFSIAAAELFELTEAVIATSLASSLSKIAPDFRNAL